ncbi:MAG: WecB/TagA/CpsF family glycosyltransferase [Candidatus Komeilibacteria bacterium]|nr:WecB/TagA/CpsF family glycosyltransferase [Candidatus Komeilibacteria bacterium]
MKTDILGIKIDTLTQNQVLEKVESFILAKTPLQIITANPEIILEASKNREYKNLINNASLVVPDGIGLLWAAKFLSLPSDSIIVSIAQAVASLFSLMIHPEYCREVLPERITGVDLMEKICELAIKNNLKIYLLGAAEGIAEETAEILKNKYPDLQIVGYDSGPSFKLKSAKQSSDFKLQTDKINQVQPDILFVAFGAPKQDFFIQQILLQLSSVKLAMGVGGAFDFISSKVRRAPLIFRDLNLEWLWRLFNQPWRFIRILNATVKFIYYTVKYKHEPKN